MWSDKMAGRKLARASKRRMLLAKSVNKWIAEHDKELDTSTLLKYTIVNRLGRLDVLRLY